MRSSLICLVVGCMACIPMACKRNDSPSEPAPTRVVTMSAGGTQIASSRTYSGTVQENNGVDLSFIVAGTLNRLTVDVGDRVKKGQLIATVDASNLNDAYKIARAGLDNARDAYNRMKMLHDAKSIADMQWVQAQNTLKQAESTEAMARKTLSDASIHAPFSGYISQKFAQPGSTMAPGIPVVRLVTIDPVKVNISVPEGEIGAISEGTAATITVNALQGRTFTGKITEKGVSANPLSRTYDVKVLVDNPSSDLLPGMICDVALRGDTTQQALVVPEQAVLIDADNSNFVWLDSAGYAVKRIVKVAALSDNGIIIDSGITPSDSIIIRGQQKVSSGMRVVSVKQ